MIKRYSKVILPIFILVVGAVGGAVFLLVRSDAAPPQSQEPPAGVQLLEWPPFVAILEMPGYSVGVNGVTQKPREVRRLVWNSPTDWKMTVLSAESVTLPDETVNTTGSYEQQDGRTYTYYDARWDETETYPLEENEILVPAGVFQSILYSGFGLETRTDGEIVVVEAFVCDGSDCDGYSTGSHHTTQGRKFEGREGVVFTDDKFRIPIEAYDIKVQYLHTNPPTPTPTP